MEFLGCGVFGCSLVLVVVCFGCCGVFRLSDAVRCDFLGLGVFWFLALGWFLFLAFCRVLPVCTVSNMQVFKFLGWVVYSSAQSVNASNFKFFEGSWFWCSSCLVFLLAFCLSFFDFLIRSNILGNCQTFLFFVRLFLIFVLQLMRRFL